MSRLGIESISMLVPRFAQRFEESDWPIGHTIDGFGREHWGDRACGIACLRMVFAHFALPIPGQLELLEEALAADAYTTCGWSHAGLAGVATRHGVSAQACVLDLEQLGAAVGAERLAMVSVTHKFPTDGTRGGHLVVVCGSRYDVVEFRDPSRWGATNVAVGRTRFAASYTGRAVVFGGM